MSGARSLPGRLRDGLRGLLRRARRSLADRVAGSSGEAPSPPPRGVRRVLRAAVRGLVWIAALALLVRLSLPFALPVILDRVAARLGLTCGYDRLDLSLLRGEVRLARLIATPKGGGEPILALDWLEVDVSPAALLRGRVVVHRLEVDGVDVLLEREADGSLALLRGLGGAGAPPPAASPPPGGGAPPPIAVDALRLSHLHVRLRDRSVAPPVDVLADLDLRLTDLDLAMPKGARPGRFEMLLRCPGVLGGLEAEGTLRGSGPEASVALEVALDRLHLAPLAGYLAPLGIRPEAREISAGVAVRARPHAGIAQPGGSLAWDVELEGLHASADGVEAVALDRTLIQISAVSRREAVVSLAIAEGVRARAERRAGGAIHALGLALGKPPRTGGARPHPTSPPEGESAGARGTAGSHAGQPAPGLAAEPDRPFRLVFRDVGLLSVRFDLRDVSVTPETVLPLRLDAHGRDVVIDPVGLGAPASIDIHLEAPGVAERITVTGTAVPVGPRRSIDAQVAAEGIDGRALSPYLAAAGLEPTFERGRLSLGVHAALASAADGGLDVDAALSKVSLADRVELAGVDLVRFAGHVGPEGRTLAARDIEVVRPRFHASREASGAVSALGLRTRPRSGARADTRDEGLASDAGAQAVATGDGAGTAPHLELGRFVLRDAELRLDDAAVDPPVALAISGGLEAEDLDADLDPLAAPADPGRIRAWIGAPGFFDRATARGTFVATPAAPRATLELVLEGLNGAAVTGWLARAGVKSELASGGLEAVVEARARRTPDGALDAEVALGRLRLADGDQDLLAIRDLRAKDVRLLSPKGRLDRVLVGQVGVERVWLAASIDADGAPGACGLRVIRSAASPTATGTPAPDQAVKVGPPAWPTSGEEAIAKGPLVELRRLHVGELALDLSDRSRPVPLELPLRAAADLGPLEFDAAARHPAKEAPFDVHAAAAGVVESVTLTGRVALSPVEARLKASLAAGGITAERLGPILAAAGIEPALESGSLRLSIRAEAGFAEDLVTATASVEGLTFDDGARGEILGMDAARLVGFRREGGAISVEKVEVVHPRAQAWRETRGLVVAGGLRLGVPIPPALRPPRPVTPAAAVSSDAASDEDTSPFSSTGTAVAGPARRAGGGASIEVRRIVVSDVGARVTETRFGPARAVTATAALEVTGLTLGKLAPPARLTLTASIPGSLDALVLAGSVVTESLEPSLDLTLDLEDLREGPLNHLLPPDTVIELTEGRVHAGLHAALEPHPAGGRRGEVVVSDVRLTDGGRPLWSMKELRLRAGRIDPGGGHVDVDEVAARGIEGRADRGQDGRLHLFGFALGERRGAPPRRPEARPEAVWRADQERVLPLVDVEKLLIEVPRFTYTDAGLARSVPLVVRDLAITNSAPLVALGPDPASNPYLGIDLRAEIDPIARLVTATSRMSPFALNPEFSIRTLLLGLRGEGITQVRPDLAGVLDGRELTDGRAYGQFVLRLDTDRHDPFDWSFLDRMFGGEFTIRKTWLRNGEKGAKLFGIGDFRVDVGRMNPKTGSAYIREIELTQPIVKVQKDERGTHILGLILKEPRPATATASAKAPASPKPPSGRPKGAGGEVVSGKPPKAPEGAQAGAAAHPIFKIDHVALADVDFSLDDRTAKPPVAIPITNVDLDVTGLVTRAFREGEELRFDLGVESGLVSLPKHSAKHLGVVGSVGSLVARGGERERRPLFHELNANGDIAFGPAPAGEVHVKVGAFELAAISGIASRSGVALNDGVLDLESTATFEQGGGFGLDVDSAFTDLDLSEPQGGALSSWIGLPAPLDAVLFALRDDDGTIKVPVRVHLDKGEVSAGAVSGAVARAIASLSADALKNAPMRTVGVVSDFGRGILSLIPGVSKLPFLSEPEPVSVPPVVIAFDTCETAPGETELRKLDALAEALASDEDLILVVRHAIGGGDYARMRERANPGPEDRRDLALRISTQRRALEDRRADLVAEARAATAAGFDDRAAASAGAAQRLDAEILEAERALDQVYELERGGAERQAGRRGRLAGIELGRARLGRVRDALVARGIADPSRIQLVRPHVSEPEGKGGGTVTVATGRRKKK